MVEESKEIVFAQDYSVLQSLELLSVVACIFVKQSVHPFLEGLPDLRPGHSALVLIPCVYGIAQQFLHTACPLLFLVDVAEILQVPKEVGKADLMAADLQREVGAVTVRLEYQPLQVRQYAMLLQCLDATGAVGEDVAVLLALQAPALELVRLLPKGRKNQHSSLLMYTPVSSMPAASSLPMYSSRAVYTGCAFLAFLSSMFFTVPSENDFTQNTSRMVSAILSNVTD